MIEEIILESRLFIEFQPICSLSKQSIIGYEALMRAKDEEGNLISPYELLVNAKKEKLSSHLDFHARRESIKAFKPLFMQNAKALLFLNFEPLTIESNQNYEHYQFPFILQEYGIPFSNVVIEIKEDAIENTKALQSFCDYFKHLGFIIALDDFGTGNSSFDRLSVVKPNIIKVDRSIMSKIEANYYHQEILSSLVNLANKVGAIILAEGVETEAECVECLKKGVDIYQGFYFCKPGEKFIKNNNIKEKSRLCAQVYKTEKELELKHCRKLLTLIDKISSSFLKEFSLELWHFEKSRIYQLMDRYKKIEAVYLLDASGIQVGDTIIQNESSSLFYSTQDGSDHIFKEYYSALLDSYKDFHLTKSYISKASGNLCVTYSKRISLEGEQYILCIDLI